MSGGSARMQGHLLPSAAPPLNRAASERLGSPRGGRAHAATATGGPSQPLERARSERLSPKKSPHGGGESSGGEGGDQLGDLDIPRLAMSHSRSSRRGRRDASDTHSASAPDVRKAHAASPLHPPHGRAKSRPTSLNNSTSSLVSLGEDAVTQFKTKVRLKHDTSKHMSLQLARWWMTHSRNFLYPSQFCMLLVLVVH